MVPQHSGSMPRVVAAAASSARELRALIVIPAREASRRLPNKPLRLLRDRTLLSHAVAAARAASHTAAVLIATDSPRVLSHAASLNIPAYLAGTSPPALSGTDRVAALLRTPGLSIPSLSTFDAVVNLQVDQPRVAPAHIDALVEALARPGSGPAPRVATLVAVCRDEGEVGSRDVVKCVRANSGNAVYFSRAVVPFVANPERKKELLEAGLFHKHIGLYAFRPRFLTHELAKLSAGSAAQGVGLAAVEDLEQLRWIEAGITMRTVLVDEAARSVDTEEDLRLLEKEWEEEEATQER